MTQSNEIRRHADGSIDFDFYHVRAKALRGAAMQDASVLRAAFRGGVVMTAVTAAVLLITAAAVPQPPERSTASQVALSMPQGQAR